MHQMPEKKIVEPQDIRPPNLAMAVPFFNFDVSLETVKAHRKILLYSQVAFVLLFMGKINKAGLYAQYFHTIQDVEIRNSQDLHQSKAKIYKELGNSVAHEAGIGPQVTSLAILPATYQEVPFAVTGIQEAQSLNEAPSLTLRLLISQPNRAP